MTREICVFIFRSAFIEDPNTLREKLNQADLLATPADNAREVIEALLAKQSQITIQSSLLICISTAFYLINYLNQQSFFFYPAAFVSFIAVVHATKVLMESHLYEILYKVNAKVIDAENIVE